MSWSNVGAPIKLDIDWQFTEPTLGVFFWFKHESAPSNGIYEIAQVELNSDLAPGKMDVKTTTTCKGNQTLNIK